MNPSSGLARKTVFTFDAREGWTDEKDDFPLKFTFGFRKSGQEYELQYKSRDRVLRGVKIPVSGKL